MIRVNSSWIAAIGYDPGARRMCIRTDQGKTYDFCGVPQEIFDSFLASGSKGRYYDTYIRDRFQCF
ncbi:KTSC domain-containing protein [Cupriavidus campinensis]